MYWTSKEVMDFIYWLTAYIISEDFPHIEDDTLKNVSGLDLMHMTPQDFRRVNPQYGQLFYDKFRQLLNEGMPP